MKKITGIVLLLLTVLLMLLSCNLGIKPIDKSEGSVNYYIYPYLKFTLSSDLTYYEATVVDGAQPATISIPGQYHTDFGSMPVKVFKGFENPGDAVNLRTVYIDVNVEKIADSAFDKADNLEKIVTTGAEKDQTWSKLPPALTRSGYHFHGWKVGDVLYDGGSTIAVDPDSPEAVPYFIELERHDAKDPTCTYDGNIEYWKCPECGKLFTDSLATKSVTDVTVHATGHLFPLVFVEATEATCQKEGNVAYYRCDRCGKAYADENGTLEIADVVIPKVDHHVSDEILHTNETHHWYQCKWCATEMDKTEHLWDFWVITVPATEHTKGSRYHDCTVCGHRITVDIPEHDHIEGEVLEKHVATCTEGAYYIEKCGNPECGEVVRFEIEDEPALGHTGDTFEFKDSTCQEEGVVKHIHCERCDQDFENASSVTPLETTVIPKKAHEYSTAWTIEKDRHYRECINCHEAKTDVSEHVYDREVVDEKYLVSSSTCQHANIYKKSCVCGKAGEENFTSGVMGDHSYTKYVSIDYQYHQLVCKWCDTVLPDSVEKHEFEETTCVKCHYEVINGSGGFVPVIVDKRPEAQLVYSRSGSSYEFTLIDSKESYPVTSVEWYLDDVLQDESGWSFSFTPPHPMTYRIMCIYSNGYGKGSKTITVNGG